MVRLIKRYGSRKLYDTEESRYVLLDDVAGWIRAGQEVRVVDNRSGEDVTAQTLTQIISEEGRSGKRLLPNGVLHEIIRASQEVVSDGVERLQNRVGGLVQRSVDRLAPVRRAREEMILLRQRLQELESSLAAIEAERLVSPPADAAAPEPGEAKEEARVPARRRAPAGSGANAESKNAKS